MLQITIPSIELYNEATQEFSYSRETVLQLEHSLVSVSKWESKFNIPFLTRDEKTTDQTLEYIRCMTLTQNVDPLVYHILTPAMGDEIHAYITAPMTATTFSKTEDKVTNREVITSELIYYWMIALNIPFECQKWHLNRLLTLINVCNIKNQPPKKRSNKEMLSRNAALNAQRKAAMNTTG